MDDNADRLAPASVANYVMAINNRHRLLDLPPPGSANVVTLALKRHRRAWASKGKRQRQAPPMRLAHINAALASMEGDTLADLRDAALVSLAFDTLARASELVALNVRDVQPEDQDATAYIAKSKTDQEGAGDYRFVSRDTFARVGAWVEAARLEPKAPLFVPLSKAARGERLSPRDVARIYKRQVGEEFTGHSTRVGAAVEQRAFGINTGQIAQAGGWKGDAMPARYTRQLSTRDSGAAILARAQGRS